uniref:septal ring lytic transglycosylase RlpA family protein n=1 Tax=Ningiella ruwaisensis TaxID=2364274 RepID=UPI0010A0BF85|nr:septal ring lytic transglycosylase RlpA family protein [Ningiella ruwaisensis]
MLKIASLGNVRPKLVFACVSLLVLQACSTQPSGRYSQKQDSAPQFNYGDIEYIEPVPAYEPYNVWNSRPYEVLGGYYTPLLTGKGYAEEGYASWYGQKFHGHTTANGETFDMFSLTAAHKTLPLPSFVQVTNLENNKSAVIRVNDRGPFHDDRIIDLSYAAAKKLGFHNKGVTKVKVEVIHVSQDGLVTVGKGETQSTLYASNQSTQNKTVSVEAAKPIGFSSNVARSSVNEQATTTEIRSMQEQAGGIEASLSDPLMFVQVAATSDGVKARDLATGLSNMLQVPNSIPKVNNIYRLHLGPLENEQKAEKLIQELKKIGFDSAFTVEFTP